MLTTENEDASGRFSDMLKTSWVKSAITVGIIFTAIALAILFLMKYLNIGNTQLFSSAKSLVAEYGLGGIFLTTIVAGTIVPLGSPALVVAAALFGIPKIPLVLVATFGFTIGMLINYALAFRLGRPYVVKKVSAKNLGEVLRFWNRWGWILYTIFGLVPVLPVEILSFACGLLKTRLSTFLLLSFGPRLAVFTILTFFGEYLGGWFTIS